MTAPRYRLRTLMAAIAVFAVLCRWGRPPGSLSYALVDAAYSPITWALSFLLGMTVARLVVTITWERWSRSVVWGLFALSAFALLYLAWAELRADTVFLKLDQGWPYPDEGIKVLGQWSAAAYPSVAFTLGTLVLWFMCVTGVLLGCLIQRPKPRRSSEVSQEG
jgi:hypothetical protein